MEFTICEYNDKAQCKYYKESETEWWKCTCIFNVTDTCFQKERSSEFEESGSEFEYRYYRILTKKKNERKNDNI